jgi:hypothetical protein
MRNELLARGQKLSLPSVPPSTVRASGTPGNNRLMIVTEQD